MCLCLCLSFCLCVCIHLYQYPSEYLFVCSAEDTKLVQSSSCVRTSCVYFNREKMLQCVDIFLSSGLIRSCVAQICCALIFGTNTPSISKLFLYSIILGTSCHVLSVAMLFLPSNSGVLQASRLLWQCYFFWIGIQWL